MVVTATTDRVDERAAEQRLSGLEATGFVSRLETEEAVTSLSAALSAAKLVPDILVNNAGMVLVSDDGIDSGDISMSLELWNLAYAAAKAGMVGLTRALAVDEAVHRITASAVKPVATQVRNRKRLQPTGNSPGRGESVRYAGAHPDGGECLSRGSRGPETTGE